MELLTATPQRDLAHVPLPGPADELTAHATGCDEIDEPIVHIFRRLPKAA